MKLAKTRLKQIIKEELAFYNKKSNSKNMLVKEFFRKEQDLAGKVQDLIAHIEGMDSVPPPVEELLTAARAVESAAGGVSVVPHHLEPVGTTVVER